MLRLIALACFLALSTQADTASATGLSRTLSQASAQALAKKADDIKLKDQLKADLSNVIKNEEREIVMQEAALKWIDAHSDDVNHFFQELQTEHPDLFTTSDASSDESEFEAQQFGFGGPFGFGGFGGPFGGFGGYGGWGGYGGGWGRGFGGWGRRW